MVFIPSRDLIHLHTRGERDVNTNITLINRGLIELARAFGTSEDEEEHIYIGKDGSKTTQGHDEEVGEREEGYSESQEQRFELNYAKDWLNGVSCLKWMKLSTDVKNAQNDDSQQEEVIEEILRRASRLIAICAGKAASGTSRRAYHFECGDNGQEISIEIQDRAFIEDALGSRTWGSAPLLVSYLLREYFSSALNQERKECLRILELGGGTGLVGLAISQYIQNFSDWQAEVCLTDYHQDVLANLKGNMQLNRLIKQHDRVQVIVSHLDWNDTQSEEVQGPFDCIVAADCIYEPNHADMIKTMAERFLALPRREISKTPPQLFLCCPLRPTHQKEIHRLEEIFARVANSTLSPSTLQITHQQDLTGWDDFGPPTLNLGNNNGHSGQQTSFRLYVIQRC